MNDELIGAAGAWRVEQGVDRKRRGVRRRFDQPEFGEPRKLLALTAHRVDREPARRHAVALARAERAKVARAGKSHDFVLVLAVVQRVVRAKSGEAEISPTFPRQLVPLEVEVGAVVAN